MSRLFSLVLFSLLVNAATAQGVQLQGYVFESGNRGYLYLVKVTVRDEAGQTVLGEVYTDKDGVFNIEVPTDRNLVLKLEKSVFETVEEKISTVGKSWGEKIFTRIEMKRKPGYLFDVTMARKRKKGEEEVDAIEGARIEVYNNTREVETLVLKDYPHPNFKVNFEQGNHYTILIRKEGFMNKRMEAFVNIEGCILCFEGVGTVQPGVSDVLTEGNSMGTLLANVELEPIEVDKAVKIENIYYDLAKYNIRDDAALELDKLVSILKINPSLVIEIGSHTDSRGKDSYNLRLSEKRAGAAADYLVHIGGISSERILSKGYGETQLVNGCSNGKECSERRHQQNRRTEFKIVGFIRSDDFGEKSLAQIIEEEKYEQLLKEVSNSEVIKVSSEEELPEAIKAEMEQNKQRGEIVAEEAEQEAAAETTADKVENTILQPASENSEPEAPVIEDHRKSDPVRPPDRGGVSEKPRIVQSDTPPGDLLPEADAEVQSEDFAESQYEGGLIVREKEIKVEIPSSTPSLLPADYKGYKVEFFVSPYELPHSHEIFSKHGKITLERRKDGSYAYLLGDFEEWRAANKFLNSIILSRYPQARVVRYKRGMRIN